MRTQTESRGYWQKPWETASRKTLRELQLQQLNRTLRNASRSPFYSQRFRECGLKPRISVLEDIRTFPFTTKEDLRKSYPAGMVCTEASRLVRLHASSGTTGRSTLVFHSRKDIEHWADLIARCLYMVGGRSSDVFQNMMSYGLFTGGLGLHYGAEKIGMLVIPIGTGNTRKQIEFMVELGVTVIHVTPSYALYVAQVVEEMGIRPDRDFRVSIAVAGAEPYSEATRHRIEQLFHTKFYNCYGLSEMNGPGVAFECPLQDGMHLWEDHFFPEIINPETGWVLPDGSEGELVLTTLRREAMPIIRYRTRDLTRIVPGRCACGRTHRRIERIKGRSDDMFIVKGVNIFPSQVETVLMDIPEVDKNYLILLDRKAGLDEMKVQIEIKREYFRGDLNQLRSLQERIRERLQGLIIVSPEVELVEPGTLPPSTGKAKRVIDKRAI